VLEWVSGGGYPIASGAGYGSAIGVCLSSSFRLQSMRYVNYFIAF
jgi:hypothetical protein